MTPKQNFERYDKANPHVYDLFVQFTKQAIDAGHRRLGAHLIVQRIRWETLIKTRGDRFKISNNHFPYYARKFMEDFPEFSGLFRTHKLKYD